MTPYYADKLKEGQEFEDFVQDALAKRGIFLGNYTSQKYQLEKGENMLGMEIKRDGRFRETGNFYMETAEKSSKDIVGWTPSGIMRDDNSWLFCIGDEKGFCVFAKKDIRDRSHMGETQDGIKARAVETPTSKGFVWGVRFAKLEAQFTVGRV